MNDDGPVVTRGILRQELTQELARYPTHDELKDTLRQELARYPTRDELKDTLRQELAHYPTRDELGMWMHVVAQQHERLAGAIAGLRQEMKASHDVLWQAIKSSRDVLFIEIGRAARVAAEDNRRDRGVLDDRYRDLPARLTTLERTVDAHARDTALHPAPSRRRPRRPPRG